MTVTIPRMGMTTRVVRHLKLESCALSGYPNNAFILVSISVLSRLGRCVLNMYGIGVVQGMTSCL
jgi:hypothetical protein